MTGQQDGVMSPALEWHDDVLVSYGEARRGIKKAPEDLFRVGRFKAFELSCHLAIQGIGDQGEHDIEIHLERDGGRQGIQMKEIHIFGNRVFDQHPMRVPFDQIQGFKPVDQKDQDGTFSATAGGDIMCLQHRDLAPLGNGMKIQIKALALD